MARVMTDELFKRVAAAVTACPDHNHLRDDAFHTHVRTIVKDIQARRARGLPLLPTEITNHLN